MLVSLHAVKPLLPSKNIGILIRIHTMELYETMYIKSQQIYKQMCDKGYLASCFYISVDNLYYLNYEFQSKKTIVT